MPSRGLCKTIVALMLSLVLPASASAGPLREAAEKAAREHSLAQPDRVERGRGRFWTALALIAGGAALATWGAIEIADSDTGPEEDNDTDDLPGANDSDTAEKVMFGGGLAAAGVGAIVLMTGGQRSSPTVAPRPGRLHVTHTVRF